MILLGGHLHLELHALGASSRSAGLRYKDAVRWKQNVPLSEKLGGLMVQECEPAGFAGCDIIFSGLDSSVAGDIG